MTSTDRIDLRNRCAQVVTARVPMCVLSGEFRAAEQYKRDAAACAAFVRSGGGLARARFAVARLEAMQAVSA